MRKRISAIFIGTVEFSKYMIEVLIDLQEYIELIGLITKKKSEFHSDFCDLSPIAFQNNIEVVYPKKTVNEEEVISWVKNRNPDVIFCLGWSELLSKELISIPKVGIIGFHPALLPQNRGRHPIIWALTLGLDNTASTFFFIEEGIDSGDIISQRVIPIKYEDDARTLYNKIIEVAKIQLRNIVIDLFYDSYHKVPQKNNFININYWRKRTPEDGKIDFRMSSKAIYNLVRALTRPYPGAYFIYKGNKIKVWKTKEEKVGRRNIEPGKVLEVKGKKILVKCYDEDGIWLIKHELSDLPKVGEYLI